MNEIKINYSEVIFTEYKCKTEHGINYISEPKDYDEILNNKKDNRTLVPENNYDFKE